MHETKRQNNSTLLNIQLTYNLLNLPNRRAAHGWNCFLENPFKQAQHFAQSKRLKSINCAANTPTHECALLASSRAKSLLTVSWFLNLGYKHWSTLRSSERRNFQEGRIFWGTLLGNIVMISFQNTTTKGWWCSDASHTVQLLPPSQSACSPHCEPSGFGLNNHITTQHDSEKEFGVAAASFKSESSQDRTQEETEIRQRGVTHDWLMISNVSYDFLAALVGVGGRAVRWQVPQTNPLYWEGQTSSVRVTHIHTDWHGQEHALTKGALHHVL